MGWPIVAACALFASRSLAAELFPYTPPPNAPAQQFEQRHISPQAQSAEPADKDKIYEQFAAKVKAMNRQEQEELRSALRNDLDGALKRGDVTTAKYYLELLKRID
jgi:hypothetical protein